jgi:hypothetical protein
MRPRSSEFEQELSKLEVELRRLEAEYNMFFAGRLPRLPWATRARVDRLIKQYDRLHIRNTAARFRFGTLQARYAAFCELWERNLRAKEEGRPLRGRKPEAAETAPPASAEPGAATAPARPAPAPGSAKPAAARPARNAHKQSGSRIVAATAIRDPTKDMDRMKKLYEQLSSARKKAGEHPVPFDSFAKVVRAQVSKLGREGGEVSFRVAVQGGKVTLTAKSDK